MTISEFVKAECAINIDRLHKTTDQDVSFDLNFWETINKILPPFFQQLSDAGLLSNGYVVHMLGDVIDKALNHKSFGPLQSIEINPTEWFGDDCAKSGSQIISELKDQYFQKPYDGYTISNKRCSSVYYNPYTMTYHDLEKANGYYNDLTGIGWTGNPFDLKFAQRVIPLIASSLNMGRFNFDTTIKKFPYTPLIHHESLPVTWEEEAVWDFLEILEQIEAYKGDEFTRLPIKTYSTNNFNSYMVFIHFDGLCEKETYLLYLFGMKDEEGDDDFIITHLMPYQLPLKMSQLDIDTVMCSHLEFMKKYLFTDPSSIYRFHSPMNLLEPEDNKDPMWSFFILGSQVTIDSTIKKSMHVNDGYLYLPKDYASQLQLINIDCNKLADFIYNSDACEVSRSDDIDKLNIPDYMKAQIRKVYDLISKHDQNCYKRGLKLCAAPLSCQS